MKGEELVNVSQAVMHGSQRYVRNLRTNRDGRVVSCDGGTIKVHVGRRREVWCVEDCEETMSS